MTYPSEERRKTDRRTLSALAKAQEDAKWARHRADDKKEKAIKSGSIWAWLAFSSSYIQQVEAELKLNEINNEI